MPDRITRRRFLHQSVLVSGAAVLADPRRLFGSALVAAPGSGRGPLGRSASSGVFAQLQIGGTGEPFRMRWTRVGGDYVLDVLTAGLMLHVPTRTEETAEIIGFDDFRRGVGRHEIAASFGTAVIAHLDADITAANILVRSSDRPEARSLA